MITRRFSYYAIFSVAALIIVSFFIVSTVSAQTRLSRNLYLGTSGADVTALQQYLKHTGDLTGEVTGTYDASTQKAVQSWQCSKNIVCSGTPSTTGYGNLGPRTRAELIAATTGGDADEIYAQIKRDSAPTVTSTASAPVRTNTQVSSAVPPPPQQEDGISLSLFVELLIALDVISPDKVQAARDFASSSVSATQTQNTQTSVANTTSTQAQVTQGGDVLSKGSRGQEVLKIQLFLRKTGDYTYPEITGYYGSVTEEAVKRYQRRNNIVSFGTPQTTGYGTVGPKTLSLIQQGVTGNTGLSVIPDTDTSSTGTVVVDTSTTDAASDALQAQDKSLATSLGAYSQSYYQAHYQSSYNDYAQAYYQSYYQGAYASPTQTTTDTAPTVQVFAPDEIIILPVYVHLLKSDFDTVNTTYLVSEIQNMFSSSTGINEHYWKQANIRWDLKDVRTYTITDGSDRTYHDAYSADNASVAYDAVPKFSQGANLGNGFNIILVGDFSAITSNGLYFSSGTTNSGFVLQDGIAFISQANTANAGIEYTTFVTAHELGHALSLGHFGDTTNMMAVGGSGFYINKFGKRVAIGPLDRNVLTSDQITAARAQAATGEPGVPPGGSGQ